MLDDLKFIHERDQQDALGIAGKQWEYLTHDFGVALQASQPITNVVLSGMGGSAFPGTFLTAWPRLTVPFEIVRNYNVPDYVDERTLFISSSHSGNTEETLEALTQAEARKADIVVITSGGKLAEIAHAKNYPLFAIPPHIQPRMVVFYFLSALASIVSQYKLVLDDVHELVKASEWLKGELTQLSAEIPANKNQAKQIAQELMGRTVIVYAGPLLSPAANKWKININENAKNTAWAGQYPEFNHNEFIGWSSYPTDKPFAVVEIRSKLEHPHVQKRFDLSERLLSGKRPTPVVVEPHGDTLLKQLLWSSALGDFVSIYLAFLNGVNPTPIELADRFKRELAAED